jgi:LPXTG-site transpeptidase (sortase) family protein
MPRKKNKRKRRQASVSNLGQRLIILGTILIAIFGIWRVHNLRLLSFNRDFQPRQTSGSKPVRVSLSRSNLTLPVTEATITDGSWEVSSSGASHWDNSANPGEGGNIVIYGHNKNNLFGPIRWLNKDDEIVLTNTENQDYRYKIVDTLVVNPDQTDYLLPTEEETLTLYTCTGFLDSKRYLVIAKPALD